MKKNWVINCKQKWQKFTDWKWWKWVYYLLLLFAIFIAVLLISDIFYVVDVLTKTREEVIKGGGIPIGAQCCWEYHSKHRFLTYYIFQNIVVLSIIFFSLKPKKFFYRCSVILVPILSLVIYRIIFPINL